MGASVVDRAPVRRPHVPTQVEAADDVGIGYDIGGRSLFLVCVGPAASDLPTVIAEHADGGPDERGSRRVVTLWHPRRLAEAGAVDEGEDGADEAVIDPVA
jgi:hypothetical protein